MNTIQELKEAMDRVSALAAQAGFKQIILQLDPNVPERVVVLGPVIEKSLCYHMFSLGFEAIAKYHVVREARAPVIEVPGDEQLKLLLDSNPANNGR